MAIAMTDRVLSEEFWPAEGRALIAKRIFLVMLGIAALALAAKIKIPLWPSPVPVTLGTLLVLARRRESSWLAISAALTENSPLTSLDCLNYTQ
jgi:hypothetical protein